MPARTFHSIINGDSRDMGGIRDEDIHLVVTSPPYWQLKDYGGDEQIGFDESYEAYVNSLNLVWLECYRVLHPGCRLCVNIGDQFARSTYYGRYKVIPIHSEVIKFCEILGFDFMGKIIWQKATTMHTSGGGSVMGSFPYPRNGIVKLDFEYILLFRKPGTAPKPGPEQKKKAKLTAEEWNLYFSGHWRFPGARQDRHLAMFPDELPRRLIRMFTFPDETVLDPFLGSGTTSRVARELGRNSIGYETNPEFIPLIREKIGPDGIFARVVSAKAPGKLAPDAIDARLKRLPYRFVDPHRLDKKADPKKLNYGSRIAAEDSAGKRKMLRVSEILSPGRVRLDSGLTIRLIGVREDPRRREKAMEFLSRMLQGKRVFLRRDAARHDAAADLPAYLYLENKTFVNARLIKTKLVEVDDSAPSRQLKKFNSVRHA